MELNTVLEQLSMNIVVLYYLFFSLEIELTNMVQVLLVVLVVVFRITVDHAGSQTKDPLRDLDSSDEAIWSLRSSTLCIN